MSTSYSFPGSTLSQSIQAWKAAKLKNIKPVDYVEELSGVEENIYILKAAGQTFYAGRTINTIEKRLKQHLNSAKKGKSLRDRTIRTLIEEDIEIVIELFQICPAEHAPGIEEVLISQLKHDGFKLCNTYAGGGANNSPLLNGKK